MSSSVNKCFLIGRLGQQPEIRHTKSGIAVANLSVATSEKYKDKSGEQQEKTEWHKVVFWDRTAEICQEYLHKGSLIYVEGSIHTNKWQDKEGVDRYTTEIKGYRMQMLGGKGDSATKQEKSPQNANSNVADNIDDIEDLPF